MHSLIRLSIQERSLLDVEALITDIDFEVSRRIFKVEVQAEVAAPKEQPLNYKSASAIDPFTQPPKQAPVPAQYVKKEEAVPVQEASPETGGFRVIPPGASQKKPGRNEPCGAVRGKSTRNAIGPN
jgi:preprotein translocase subunit SecA